MTIDRCLCYNVLFEDLQEIATATRATSVAALQCEVEFGKNCRLCHPYVRRMLETHETTFNEIITEADEPALTKT